MVPKFPTPPQYQTTFTITFDTQNNVSKGRSIYTNPMKSLRGLKKFDTQKYTCFLFGRGRGGVKDGGGARERETSLRLLAVVVILGIVLLITAITEARDRRNINLPAVGSMSYLSEQTQGGRRVVSEGREGAERLRGVVIEGEDEVDHGHPALENAYHLVGGPLKRVSRHSTKAPLLSGNVPDVYQTPWQYGLRSPKSFGGADDEELLMVVPQGDPQPSPAESPFVVDASDAKGRADILRQIDLIQKRYYDAPDLLASYQLVMNNQHRLKERLGGQAKPIQEVRAHEHELPKLNW